jgi:hypothetical protein
MEKKIAIVVACLASYFVLNIVTAGKIKIILLVGLLGYGVYKVGKY